MISLQLEVVHSMHQKAPPPAMMKVNKEAAPISLGARPAVIDSQHKQSSSFSNNLKYDAQDSGGGLKLSFL